MNSLWAHKEGEKSFLIQYIRPAVFVNFSELC